jgi:carbon-monoxide dehydrogenase iron sulfur subunit
MKRIEIDREKCIGCLTCVCACMVSHQEPDARNRVVIDSKNKPAPIFCRHCDKPECTYTCMTGAMRKNTETGLVEYDRDRCASCYMCIMACPYGVLKADGLTHQVIMKCDFCMNDRFQRTREPHESPFCVEKCPMGAIVLEVLL